MNIEPLPKAIKEDIEDQSLTLLEQISASLTLERDKSSKRSKVRMPPSEVKGR